MADVPLDDTRAVVRRAGSPGRGSLPHSIGGAIFVLPGVVWLAAFFLFPLVIILVVSLGTNDSTGHIDLSRPDLGNYVQALRPEYVPAFVNSMRYSLSTTVLSIVIGYPIAYWISRYGGKRKVLL